MDHALNDRSLFQIIRTQDKFIGCFQVKPHVGVWLRVISGDDLQISAGQAGDMVRFQYVTFLQEDYSCSDIL